MNINFVNDSDDPTYENWLALFACIVNKKLSAVNSLKIMGVTGSSIPKKKKQYDSKRRCSI